MAEFLSEVRANSAILSRSIFFGYPQGFAAAALLQQGVKFLTNSNNPGAVHALTSSAGFLHKVALCTKWLLV